MNERELRYYEYLKYSVDSGHHYYGHVADIARFSPMFFSFLLLLGFILIGIPLLLAVSPAIFTVFMLWWAFSK